MDENNDVLLVEDNDSDAELITMALKELDTLIYLKRVIDGVEALEYLTAKKNVLNTLKLILLDIKLPRLNGIEVLSRIKSNNDMKSIPVVMLSSSREEQDIITCYNTGANAYVVKPVDYYELLEALKCTGKFWCEVNQTIT